MHFGEQRRTCGRRLGVKGQCSASAAPNLHTSSSRLESASLSTYSAARQVGTGGRPARDRRRSRVAGQLLQPVPVTPPGCPAHASLTHPIMPSTAVVHRTQPAARSAFDLRIQRLPASANKTAIKSQVTCVLDPGVPSDAQIGGSPAALRRRRRQDWSSGHQRRGRGRGRAGRPWQCSRLRFARVPRHRGALSV